MQSLGFILRHLDWAWFGQDTSNEPEFGKLPLTAEETLDHIEGTMTREAVGEGDEGWCSHLEHMGVVHPALKHDDLDGRTVGVKDACWGCK